MSSSLSEVALLIDYGVSVSSDAKAAGPRLLRITDIQDGNVDWESVPGVAGDSMFAEKRYLETGDIVFARTGGTVGKTFLVRSVESPSVFASYLIRVRCGEKMLPQYLALFLQSDSYWRQILKGARGGAQPNINSKMIGSLQIPVPDLAEQRKVVDEIEVQIGQISVAIKAGTKRQSLAVALESSLQRSAFADITPISIGIPLEAPPTGWSWKSLGDLARLESGHTPSRKRPEWWGGDIPWISLPDIRALDGKVALDTKEKTNADGITNSSARILPVDTVVLSRTASVGFVSILGAPMATSQDFVNWVPGEDLAPRFLMHALRASRDYFLANASGAIHKTLYMPAVKDFHIAVPDRATQDSIVAQLDEQLAAQAVLRHAAETELEAIRSLPAAILRQVFHTDAA